MLPDHLRTAPNTIFVFGSNLSGIHGAGAAAYAANYFDAQWGVGEGLTGKSYALPTKGVNITFMPLTKVAGHIDRFLTFADEHPEMDFIVTCVGCGLAGFTHGEIAPMFRTASMNCLFDTNWQPWLGIAGRKYWGTF
jgi:hypothetical protein